MLSQTRQLKNHAYFYGSWCGHPFLLETFFFFNCPCSFWSTESWRITAQQPYVFHHNGGARGIIYQWVLPFFFPPFSWWKAQFAPGRLTSVSHYAALSLSANLASNDASRNEKLGGWLFILYLCVFPFSRMHRIVHFHPQLSMWWLLFFSLWRHNQSIFTFNLQWKSSTGADGFVLWGFGDQRIILVSAVFQSPWRPQLEAL